MKPRPDGSTEDNDDNFITYMLIYFFTTLGSLLLLTIIVLSIAIVALRMRNCTPKDTPLLSEDDTIAVMKQTGYVNLTYKFFDRVKEVYIGDLHVAAHSLFLSQF